MSYKNDALFHYTVMCPEVLHFELNGTYPITNKNFTWNMSILNLYYIHFRTLFMRFLSIFLFILNGFGCPQSNIEW